MHSHQTSEIVRRFNQAFAHHNFAGFEDLIAPDFVLQPIQPAPAGTRCAGYDVNLTFWQTMAMAADRSSRFEVEDTAGTGDRADIRWRFHFCDGGSVRGVSLIRVRDGRIVEALAYAKTPAPPARLPE